jgi:hypothetical protein
VMIVFPVLERFDGGPDPGAAPQNQR